MKSFDRFRLYTSLPHDLGDFKIQVFAWEGPGVSYWVKALDGKLQTTFFTNNQLITNPSLGSFLPKMRRLCSLSANLSSVKPALRSLLNTNGQQYWQVDYKVAIIFGGTQIKARLQWYENVSIGYLRYMDYKVVDQTDKPR